MNHSKALPGLVITTLLHSYCCIFPMFIGVWGGFSIMGELLKFQPVFWLIQGVVLIFTLYGYYFRNSTPTKVKRVRIFFVWGLLLYSIGVYVIPHTGWFKSEEEKLMTKQISKILKLESGH